MQRSEVLRQRIEGCREFREQSTPSGDAYKLKDTPHLFRPNKHSPLVPYVGIPIHVGESRRYFTVQRLEPEVICSNANFQVEDKDGLLFGLISSSMFMAWQRTIGGKIKSDLRFSNTLVWNTFPLPELTDKQRTSIIKAGEKVLEARALHPERSLAQHYAPLSMDPALVRAHDALDRVVDKAFGASRKLTNERQRLELLFRNYSEMTE